MDYLIDFLPFFPFTQGVLDRQWGPEVGYLIDDITLVHVQILWGVFALFTWLLTIVLFRKIHPWTRWKTLLPSLLLLVLIITIFTVDTIHWGF
jgi:hypothetical protein